MPAEAGFFPLDQQLGLGEGAWSEGVEREAVYLSGALSSFELAAEILKRLGQIHISEPSVWRRSQEAGREFRRVEEAERIKAMAMPSYGESPGRVARRLGRMGASLDGAIIYVRKEGWKETKIGVVFDIEVLASQDKETGEMMRLAHAVGNSYTAHLGGPETAGEKLWAEAHRRQWEQARDTIVLGDGAAWIWNQAALHFGQSQQAVDWYHAKEHLLSAARFMKPEGGSAYTRWLNSRETLLYQGHADKIADELEKAASTTGSHGDDLLSEAGYFRSNHKRMNYIELRENEWPIGSGMVESGAKQFKARFCGPGMRWSRSGADNLLPIRAAVLSGRFDQLWAAAKNLPPI